MGTETRRPEGQFIPPVQEPYAYIIFRASEVKDLAVDEPTPRRNVHDDPAVLGASAPIVQTPFGRPGPGQQPPQPPAQQPLQAPPSQPPQAPAQQRQNGNNNGQQRQGQPPAATAPPAVAPQQPAAQAGTAPKNPAVARTQSVNSANASLESVERALGDLRVSEGHHHQVHQTTTHHINNHHQRGGARRGGHHGGRGGHHHTHHGDSSGVKVGDLRVPTTDFDFASSNAKFDKAALGPRPASTSGAEGATATAETNGAEATGSTENGKGKEKEQPNGAAEGATAEDGRPPAYDPKKSFFDSLSSGSNAPTAGEGNGRGRGGRRGGGGRNRREEERERNVATFGEPGGIGLMGPGAYVGGWGGYGRRGGRGRRGGSAVGAR
ncbi:hypothetical protein NLI96_g3718 [Meripilus lineatus]|uniref:Uncharacterized protein n=1 Tax=Meripilus lineatus TaxID=2056292 RepID=A0AAD5V8D4_9APHY|nr:hypothetical protein NLI96_g3718 [Physisporinus lineatus]